MSVHWLDGSVSLWYAVPEGCHLFWTQSQHQGLVSSYQEAYLTVKYKHIIHNTSSVNVICADCIELTYKVYPKVPEIWILRANGYEYIEIPLGVSPHTLLESVWQAASSWVVGFSVGKRLSMVVFRRLCGFAMADLREQRVCIKFCFRNARNVWWQQFRPDTNLWLV
jgi:hypothetical protein